MQNSTEDPSARLPFLIPVPPPADHIPPRCIKTPPPINLNSSKAVPARPSGARFPGDRLKWPLITYQHADLAAIVESNITLPEVANEHVIETTDFVPDEIQQLGDNLLDDGDIGSYGCDEPCPPFLVESPVGKEEVFYTNAEPHTITYDPLPDDEHEKIIQDTSSNPNSFDCLVETESEEVTFVSDEAKDPESHEAVDVVVSTGVLNAENPSQDLVINERNEDKPSVLEKSGEMYTPELFSYVSIVKKLQNTEDASNAIANDETNAILQRLMPRRKIAKKRAESAPINPFSSGVTRPHRVIYFTGDNIPIMKLADLLDVRGYHILGVLIEFDIFSKTTDSISLDVAKKICSKINVDLVVADSTP